MEISLEEKEAIEYLENQDNSVNWNYPTLQAILCVLNLIDKLQKENKELRQWKYVIDTYEDLDKLKELDIIKIKGKEYISKDKIREIIYPSPDNMIPLEVQTSDMYMKLKDLVEE